jgi:DNA (cytosine-5)-methyltransferase 1
MLPSPTDPSISLFSGAGGLDLGLEKAGLRFRVWVEIDPDSQETLRRSFEIPASSLFSDLTEVRANDLLRAAGVDPGDVFAVAGGPPCQAFSTAGRRLSIHDPRGALIEKYFDIIEATMPRFFVFENVRGLLSAALSHRPLSKRGPGNEPLSEAETLGSLYKLFIRPRFEALGYEVVAGLVDAADYGVPQRRTRVIVLGSREGEFRSKAFFRARGRPLAIHDLMEPTHSGPPEIKKSRVIASRPAKGLATWRTLAEAFQRLPDEAPEFIPYSPSRAEVFRLIPAGGNWRYIRDNPQLFPPGLLEEVMGGALHSSGGRVGFWRRLTYDEPSPTLTTSPVQLATGLCHPEETRPLSVQEYKLIQDFPPDYSLAGSTASKYRQAGNAVPVGLAEAVGRALLRTARGVPWVQDNRGSTTRQLALVETS